ncbi:hypothetical protein [Streptomyces scabiei]|uniref:hypothetical protein n=1 Tax=Streptomyces scabiei TaxID=1930 RepID=UPI001B32952D|nr:MULTISPECIES: hypothetical protein [Streptomyces]MBP5896420.1 hypothetical protein [Streptomyces sp. LBUM 1481]MDX3122745.1 hypothetical protein [Streptomyces scabiei]MDX3199344.1 hypothetical protein [Streptomyces scabiei]MDX3223216.1 hypothetical protein [Streptomyces scabiei]
MPRWSVYVEYDARVPDEAHDAAADHLADFHAAITTAPNGNFAIQLSVEAPAVESAERLALAATEVAVVAVHGRAALIGIEVMTEEEFDRRIQEPLPLPDLAGRAEVAAILSEATGRTVSPTRAGQIMRTRRFQDHAPIMQELASGPVCLAYQVRHFAKIWATLPGPKPEHSKES